MSLQCLLGQSWQIEFETFQSKDATAHQWVSNGVLVDEQGTLATVIVVGVNPKSATLEGESLVLIGYDEVSGLTLLKLPESLKQRAKPVSLARENGLVPGSGLFSEGSQKPHRLINKDKDYKGQVLPLILYRVRFVCLLYTSDAADD